MLCAKLASLRRQHTPQKPQRFLTAANHVLADVLHVLSNLMTLQTSAPMHKYAPAYYGITKSDVGSDSSSSVAVDVVFHKSGSVPSGGNSNPAGVDVGLS